MEYRGYEIVQKRNYVEIIDPNGSGWTEDTVKEAKEAIDQEIDGTKED